MCSASRCLFQNRLNDYCKIEAPDKTHLIKEALIASIIVIMFTWLISFFPLKFEFVKAIRQDVYGFDIYDLYYTGKNKESTIRDSDMVLVQIADDRISIAAQIKLIENYKPSVLAIDAVFPIRKDPLADSSLLDAIKEKDNLVFASLIDTADHSSQSLHVQENFFDTLSNYKSGYINFSGDQFSVIRNYPPFLLLKGKQQFSFSSRVAQLYAPEKFNELKNRAIEQEIINYTGNLERYTCITKEELTEFSKNNELLSLLKNKIVILGYFVKYPPLVLSDLHFSPLNEQFAGKSFPDMYGIVIHANILSMILKSNYARSASQVTSYLFAFLITSFFLFYILHLYSGRDHPKHTKIHLIQFLLILIVLYFFLEIFNLFLWKVPLLPILISLVLSVELLGIYKSIALWLHKEIRYHTIFIHH